MAQITGTRGNDTLKGSKGSDVFVYANGDGKDTITNYEEDDTIKISSGTVSKISTTKAGNVVFTVGTGKITVKDAADKIVTYEDADGVKNFYPIDFNSKGTSATLLSAYGKDEFDLDDFDGLKNLDASKVTRALEIEGNKLANKIIGTALADEIDGDKGNDSITGGKGNDKLYGGDGADTFTYASGDGSDTIYDYDEEDIIKITSGSIKNITTSKAGDVTFKIGSGKITVKNAADKIVTYEDADGVKNFYLIDFNSKGTSATLLSAYGKDEFDLDDFDGLKNLDASKVTRALEIEGNKLANKIIGTALADEIDGDKGNDSITGGKGNDTLTGGAGKDVFIFAEDSGSDTITDFTTSDKIQIVGGTSKNVSATIAKNGDVLVSYGSGSITIQDAGSISDKIKFVDEKGNNIYPFDYSPGSVLFNAASTAATLRVMYSDDTFDAANYADTLATIDASAVNYDLEIIGNKRANKIIGGEGNDIIRGEAGNDALLGGDGFDSLWGGAGNDTLTGGDGEDKFIYRAGDGNDTITDYDAEFDTIIVLGTDRFESAIVDTAGNVKFGVGDGQIVVQGGANRYIEILDGSGNNRKQYIPPRA